MLVLSNGTYKVYVRRGVVRVRGANGEEYVVDSTVDAIVVATSRVSLTAKAIRLLAMNGVDVVILAPNGEPVARVYPPIINKTVLARRGQFEAMVNGKGLKVSRVLVKAKLMNQANLLRYLAKARRVEWLKDEAIKLDELALSLDRVNGSEGLIEVEAGISQPVQVGEPHQLLLGLVPCKGHWREVSCQNLTYPQSPSHL